MIKAQGLSKSYGRFSAVDDVSFTVERGRIVGLIGPNGAGKTTVLKALLGLTSFKGQLSVFGLNPSKDRHKLMQKVCFIADVAVLPKWLTTKQALTFVEGVHPQFNRNKAEDFLAKTQIKMKSKVGQLSKGMIVQLHLALVLAIDAELLVLDEPTLGLDILFRKEFYHTLLTEFFDDKRSIIITTHQVEEIEGLLSDVMFIQKGKIVLDAPMSELSQRFIQVHIPHEMNGTDALSAESATYAKIEKARQYSPLSESSTLNSRVFLFDGLAREKAEQLGEVRRPELSDLFVATLKEA